MSSFVKANLKEIGCENLISQHHFPLNNNNHRKNYIIETTKF